MYLLVDNIKVFGLIIMKNSDYKINLWDVLHQKINVKDSDIYRSLLFIDRRNNIKSYVSEDDIVRDISEVLDFFSNPFVVKELIFLPQKESYIQGGIGILFSYMSASDVNLVVGKKNKYYFILGQQVTVADWILFPEFDLCVVFCHTLQTEVKLSLKNLYIHLNSIKRSTFSGGCVPVWGGVILSQIRPFHYFYGVMPALNYIVKNNLVKHIPKIYELEERDFFDIKSLYSLDSNKITKKKFEEINKFCLENNVFLFKLGFDPYNPIYREHIESFDVFLLNSFYFSEYQHSLSNFFINKDKKDYFVLWLGVDSEKRKWFQHNEAIFLIVDFLLNFYNHVYLFVDGLTATISTSHNIISNSVYCDILDKFNHNDRVHVLNCAYKTPIEKIKILNSLVDWHISNGLTPSMWPSRFARLPGLMYVSQHSYKYALDLHIKHSGVLINKYLVQDDPESNRSSPDEVSYSIDSQMFLQFFQVYFLMNKFASRLFIENMFSIEKIIGEKYIALNNDPHILLLVPDFLRREDNMPFSVTFYFDISKSTYKKDDDFFQVFFDYGDGFSEKNSKIVKLSENNFFDFLVTKPISKIRLDPTNLEGKFYMYDFLCMETNKIREKKVNF